MTQGKNILLVEEHSILAKLTSMELINVGHSVTIASQGVEAFNLLNTQTFDLLITDLHMPEMDGIELITKLKKHDINLPIIVLSASHRDDVEIQLGEIGVEQFIDKPLTDNKIALLLYLVTVL